MHEYNFETLNDKEFEHLTRDLLQLELKRTLETFKPGKDEGIDLRSIKLEKNNEKLVIQAKHWHTTGYKKLLNHLKKIEIQKIQKIKPTRYILSTSVELSPANKKELQEVLAPFVNTPSDIYGRQDLNNLLSKYPKIEKNHYKLWLSSLNILNEILHNGVKGRSEFIEANIKRNIALYVPNDKYGDAQKILNKERFLVIIGVPGIGKTILARMLVYELLGKGYELISITDNVSDAESLWNTEKKQVFYFDDFLGSNYLEIFNPRNSESALIQFLKRAKGDPKKRTILTSRTIILNQARQHSSKLNDPIIDLNKHEIKVEDYTDWTKAQILYNHLFYSALPPEYLHEITNDKNYWKIIKHRNFSPRLIEFLTDTERLVDVEPQQYLSFILKNFDHPELIWKNPYENQLNDYSKFFITTLFSLGSGEESILKSAFEARINYEIQTGGFQKKHNVFNKQIEELLGGYIKAEHDGKKRTYDFFNPSIVDFLINYFNNNPDEKWRLLESAQYIEQFTERFSIYQFSNKVEIAQGEELQHFQEIIKLRWRDLSTRRDGLKEIQLIELFYDYFDLDEVKDEILELFEKINFDEISVHQYDAWLRMLETIYHYDWWAKAIVERWNDLAESLFKGALTQENFKSILDIFESYSKDFSEYSSDPRNQTLVEYALEGYFDDQVNDIERGNGDIGGYYSAEEIGSRVDEFYDESVAFVKKFLPRKHLSILDRVLEIDKEEIAANNLAQLQKEGYPVDGYEEERFRGAEERERIDDLFSK